MAGSKFYLSTENPYKCHCFEYVTEQRKAGRQIPAFSFCYSEVDVYSSNGFPEAARAPYTKPRKKTAIMRGINYGESTNGYNTKNKNNHFYDLFCKRVAISADDAHRVAPHQRAPVRSQPRYKPTSFVAKGSISPYQKPTVLSEISITAFAVNLPLQVCLYREPARLGVYVPFHAA
ncbi:hypothetical protein CEXT_38521 [Caerostris extrusa]|uniref:Uncharacterized protein n=1 Tax=Caerostris extrusa TaxID=172846 RepID=A0AAV4RHK1_CAEEX|nr:hypothetical protein CEXT_38521 [Caerostris extrusa]